MGPISRRRYSGFIGGVTPVAVKEYFVRGFEVVWHVPERRKAAIDRLLGVSVPLGVVVAVLVMPETDPRGVLQFDDAILLAGGVEFWLGHAALGLVLLTPSQANAAGIATQRETEPDFADVTRLEVAEFDDRRFGRLARDVREGCTGVGVAESTLRDPLRTGFVESSMSA